MTAGSSAPTSTAGRAVMLSEIHPALEQRMWLYWDIARQAYEATDSYDGAGAVAQFCVRR